MIKSSEALANLESMDRATLISMVKYYRKQEQKAKENKFGLPVDASSRDAAFRLRITESQKNNVLDISELGLSKIPLPLDGVPSRCTKALVSKNDFDQYPAELLKFPNLEEINLSFNLLTELQQTFAFVHLKSLDLSSNKFTNFPTFGACPNLAILDLSNNQISTWPENFAYLSTVTHLNLQRNQLSSLPSGLTALSILEDLDLRNNKLTKLTPVLTQLQSLQFLKLGGNPLTSPPLQIISRGLQAVLSYLREDHTEEEKHATKPLPSVRGERNSPFTRKTSSESEQLKSENRRMKELLTKLTKEYVELRTKYNKLLGDMKEQVAVSVAIVDELEKASESSRSLPRRASGMRRTHSDGRKLNKQRAGEKKRPQSIYNPIISGVPLDLPNPAPPAGTTEKRKSIYRSFSLDDSVPPRDLEALIAAAGKHAQEPPGSKSSGSRRVGERRVDKKEEKENRERERREKEMKEREQREREQREADDKTLKEQQERDSSEKRAKKAEKQAKEAQRKAQEEKDEAERKEREEQEKREESERQEREAAAKKAREEQEKREREAAEQKAREEAERQEQQEREREAAKKAQEAQEEAERRAREEQAKREEAERQEREVAAKKAREEQENREREAAEQKAREEQAKRQEAERQERERKEREAAARKAQEEAEQKARAEQENRAREEAKREEAERQEREAAAKRAQEEQQKHEREEQERRAREAAEMPRIQLEIACPNESCRTIMPATAAFCKKCGTKLQHATPAPQPVTTHQPPTNAKIQCTSCHGTIDAACAFCKFCGTKNHTKQPSPSPTPNRSPRATQPIGIPIKPKPAPASAKRSDAASEALALLSAVNRAGQIDEKVLEKIEHFG